MKRLALFSVALCTVGTASAALPHAPRVSATVEGGADSVVLQCIATDLRQDPPMFEDEIFPEEGNRELFVRQYTAGENWPEGEWNCTLASRNYHEDGTLACESVKVEFPGGPFEVTPCQLNAPSALSLD